MISQHSNSGKRQYGARFFTTPKYSLVHDLSSVELLELVCGILASLANYVSSTRIVSSQKGALLNALMEIAHEF